MEYRVKISHPIGGTPFVVAYEPGDLVRLTRNETGEHAMGQAGDWGCVERVGPGGVLTILVAGYSQSTKSDIVRLSDIPMSKVEACDERGMPVPSSLRQNVRREGVRHSAQRGTATVQQGGGPSWTMAALASFGAVLLIAGVAIALRSFGPG